MNLSSLLTAKNQYAALVLLTVFSLTMIFNLPGLSQERHALTSQEIDARLLKNPKDPVALLARAKVRTQAHMISMAIDDFEAVLKMQPMNREALEDCSKLNMSGRRWKAAVSNFNALQKLAPRAEVFADGGDAKFQVKDYDGAAHDWKECSRLKPDEVGYIERAGFGCFLLGEWLEGAQNFERAFEAPKTVWPLADAAFAQIGYGLSGKKDKQTVLWQKIAARKPVDMDLFDGYVIDYMGGKIDAAALVKKRSGDPYYVAQSNFFIGFDLASKGKTKDAIPYLQKCDIAAWAPTDDFKFPLEAIAKRYLARIDSSTKQVSK
ncbi:MAG TPA: hypothetical protein V6C97_29895 [Oculatellaceae cyanobacterium]